MVDDQQVEGIYCHFDGYVDGVGKLLYHCFDSQKTKELMQLGNISFLTTTLYPTTTDHSFYSPEEGVIVAYGRDRGEPGQEALRLPTYEFLAGFYPSAGVDYFYLLELDGTWMVRSRFLDGSLTSWKPLGKILTGM